MINSEIETTSHKLVIRNLRISDYDDISEIMQEAYARMGGEWKFDEFSTLLSLFPEGQIGVEDKGTVVAAALTLITGYDYLRAGMQHIAEADKAAGAAQKEN